ncbi:hypothetical protein ACHAXT_006597 [Thalassiosira profunda]
MLSLRTLARWPPLLLTAASVRGEGDILWSSTGGGWRAMFADIGFANAFRRAGLFPNATYEEGEGSRFASIATVSGGSWFSTQLFYSEAFYNRTIHSESAEEIEGFVRDWMASYYAISTDVDDDARAACDISDITSSPYYDPSRDFASVWYDVCLVLVTHNWDWAYFIQEMLKEAASDYGDATFANTTARPELRINPLKSTDLIIQSGLAPNSRVRTTGNAVYLGYESSNGSEELFTVPLSAAWIVEDSGAYWQFGTDDKTDQLDTYTAPTPDDHSWDDWEDFYLLSSEVNEEGGVVIDNEQSSIGATRRATFRVPFGGTNAATVVQVASTSSAAGGNGSPRAPSFYTQVFSIGRYGISTKTTKTVWRVLAGIAAGLGTGLVVAFIIRYMNSKCGKWKCRRQGLETHAQSLAVSAGIDGEPAETKGGEEPVTVENENTNDPPVATRGEEEEEEEAADEHADELAKSTDNHNVDADDLGISRDQCCADGTAKKWAIGLGCIFGIFFGLLTAFVYGIGSILVPNVYDGTIDTVYKNSSFDNFAVCSQWPDSCGEEDGFLVDGWFVDNPALVANVAHYQKQNRDATTSASGPLKVIVTNCNEVWNTTYNRAQILNYFSSYFNEGVSPGGFLWAPGYWAPYRSPQIFRDYLDEESLDALLEPIPESNITTALLRGTTVDNPSFGVTLGLSVEMLLINLNEEITTFVIGEEAIENYTEPLAEMTSHIATNEVLIQRVRDFVG